MAWDLGVSVLEQGDFLHKICSMARVKIDASDTLDIINRSSRLSQELRTGDRVTANSQIFPVRQPSPKVSFRPS